VHAPVKSIAIAAAALLLVGACGQPSTAPGSDDGAGRGGNSGSGDKPVASDPGTDKPAGGVAGGGGKALLVEPKGDSLDPTPSHWDEVEIIDGDTIKVYFYSGVEPCHVLDHVDLDYGAKKVRVTLYQGTGENAADKPCIELAVHKAVEIDLDEPLDGRRVVDGGKSRFERS
jgi:hypothetical protein